MSLTNAWLIIGKGQGVGFLLKTAVFDKAEAFEIKRIDRVDMSCHNTGAAMNE